jgi:rubredoxin-NAD+ reductase
MTRPIIIIGTGLAGYQLAREFRRIDKTTPLTLITADRGQFYSKPQLSAAFTAGKSAEQLAMSDAATMATQLNATILTQTKVTAIHTEQQNIEVESKSYPYQKLILALGATPIRPPLAGPYAHEVVTVNHLEHYSVFQKLAENKKRIVILGAGLIGCEFANDLSNVGFEVHVIAPVAAPLDLLLPTEIGLLLKAALEKQQVSWHLPATATWIDKEANAFAVTLSNGKIIHADLILSAIGLTPNTSLAISAGIKVNRGIQVNANLETNIPHIYAIGDCAEVEGHLLPYIAPLLNCVRALAKTLSNETTTVDYPAMPITVKTPAYPLVICPPPRNLEGTWDIQKDAETVRAYFYDHEKQLRGFVLTHAAVSERLQLIKTLPKLF